jgi:hypothetical protein
MRTKETGIDRKPGEQEPSINASAWNPSHKVQALTYRRDDGLSTSSGRVVVAAVFCLVFLVMGSAFSSRPSRLNWDASSRQARGPSRLFSAAQWPSFMVVVSSRAFWPIESAPTE